MWEWDEKWKHELPPTRTKHKGGLQEPGNQKYATAGTEEGMDFADFEKQQQKRLKEERKKRKIQYQKELDEGEEEGEDEEETSSTES